MPTFDVRSLRYVLSSLPPTRPLTFFDWNVQDTMEVYANVGRWRSLPPPQDADAFLSLPAASACSLIAKICSTTPTHVPKASAPRT